MNKKSKTYILMEAIVYIIPVLIFLSLFLFGIVRIGNNSALYEQIYAKELALLLDKVEPGMEIELDITRAYNLAAKHNFKGTIVNIDNAENKVTVKLAGGEGYSHYFFNDVDVVWNVDKEKRTLFLNVHTKTDEAKA
jgi:hypothetical protein